MESLPPAVALFILQFAKLFRAEVFDSFIYLFLGLLMGEAKYGTVRASVFAPPDYQPQRLSDLFCRHKFSSQAFMAQLVEVVLNSLYGRRLPERLFWIADATHTEKPYAEKVSSLGWFHRTKRVAGRTTKLKGHCYVFAAHLYQHTSGKARIWASALVGALLYVKGRSIPQLVGELARQLRLPPGVRHCWIVDRGILSRGLLRELRTLQQYALGRVRCNQVVYFPPEQTQTGGRQRVFGAKCRVDELRTRYAHRLRRHKLQLRVWGREQMAYLDETVVLLRGVERGQAIAARCLVVTVPGLKQLQPWYLVTTDLELDPVEAVAAYGGRAQIEVNFDEVKELGLGHYQGRSGQGVRRWPLFLAAVQMLLKLMATNILPVELPTLNWGWYQREDTVGQVRRRLIEHCRPRLSRAKEVTTTSQ